MSSPQPGAPRSRARPSAGAQAIGALLLVALGLVFVETLFVVGVGMVPSLVALVIDRRPEKYAAFSVACTNIVGILPFLLDLWTGPQTIDAAVAIVGDAFFWLSCYAAAAVGWMIYFIMPAICTVFVKMRSDREVARLREYQNDLIEEWGRDVTQLVTDKKNEGGDSGRSA